MLLFLSFQRYYEHPNEEGHQDGKNNHFTFLLIAFA